MFFCPTGNEDELKRAEIEKKVNLEDIAEVLQDYIDDLELELFFPYPHTHDDYSYDNLVFYYPLLNFNSFVIKFLIYHKCPYLEEKLEVVKSKLKSEFVGRLRSIGYNCDFFHEVYHSFMIEIYPIEYMPRIESPV